MLLKPGAQWHRRFDLIDGDVVSFTNLNRQIIALTDTVGKPKVEAEKERIAGINPECRVEALQLFFTKETALDFTQYDYVVDAIDTVSSKLELICRLGGRRAGDFLYGSGK